MCSLAQVIVKSVQVCYIFQLIINTRIYEKESVPHLTVRVSTWQLLISFAWMNVEFEIDKNKWNLKKINSWESYLI
jgi:hypothetical protein